jgi:capsular exopolysaccharide synthesis family protein
MTNLQAKIGEEVGRVVQTVGNDVAVARARVGSLQGSLAQLQGQSGVQGQDRVKLKQLEANATSTRSLYDAFLSRFKQTQDQEGVQTPDARILSRAVIPSAPSFPNKILIFGVAIPFSVILGLLLAFAAERLDNGFRTSNQVEAALGVPVLGTVPELKGEKNAAVSPADWVIEKPLSFFAEAIRSIQLGLTLSNVDRKPKVVLVTSSTPGEGKTTVALSLARQAARNGEKVILVDGDLRRPRVAAALGLDKLESGVVEALMNTVPLEQCLHKDPQSGLLFLPSATKAANPPDLLSSSAMENLISILARTADLVVIDSAPLLPVNDTKILTRLADAVLFVVRWEKTPREAAKAAIRNLADVGVSVAGVVMTRTDVTRFHYYSYGYQGYYNYASYYND